MNAETALQNRIRKAASKAGLTMFRNNVGVCVRYTSKAIVYMLKRFGNRAVQSRTAYGLCKGSSDLIGWKPYTITMDDVGRTVAIFTAIEIKTDTGRETKEQENFRNVVNCAGGNAIICRDERELEI